MKFLDALWQWSNGSAGDSAGAASSQRDPTREARYHGRFKILCPVTIAWTGAGGSTQKITVRGVDMSGAGVCVESAKPVAPGSQVYVQVKQLKLMGRGVVRHCMRRGGKYRIGLEFPNPLTNSF